MMKVNGFYCSVRWRVCGYLHCCEESTLWKVTITVLFMVLKKLLEELQLNFKSLGHFRNLLLYSHYHPKALLCVCVCAYLWEEKENETQTVRGRTTKVLCTCVFLCMCVDDQSAWMCERKRVTCITFFACICVCVSEGVSDQSTYVWRLLIRLTPEPRAAPLGDCG